MKKRKLKQVMDELEATANSCRRNWGMGFPVISIKLLRPFLCEMIEIAKNNRSRIK